MLLSKIEIRVLRLENDGTSGIDDFREYCLHLSGARSVKCQWVSDGVVLEGDTPAILEILQELDNCSFRIGARKRVVVRWKIDESHKKPLGQGEAAANHK